jgi:hypothetical protein
MKETIFYVFLAFSVIFDAHNDKNEWIFNTWSMFSKTCPIPVCDKSFEKTPLSSLLSKRHGNGGSCLKKHEKLKIKIFAERVMKSHIYSSIDFYIGISKNHFKRRHYRVCSPTDCVFFFFLLFLSLTISMHLIYYTM